MSVEQKNLFVQELKKYKSICWYPSAGSDLRPLLYLSKPYFEKYEELSAEHAVLPDLFILTDYGTNTYEDYSNYTLDKQNRFKELHVGTLKATDVLFEDKYTRYTVKAIKKIVIDDLEVNECMYNMEPTANPGTGYLMTITVYSHSETRLEKSFGTWDIDVLYMFAENTAFAKTILLQNMIDVDYIVKLRYGGNCGGSKDTFGVWIYYLANPLNVKYYISDNEMSIKYGDKVALDYLKADSTCSFDPPHFQTIHERLWYRGEWASWFKVKKE